jgi:putative membrane protein
MESVGAIPYCGIAPIPSEIWSRWNLDPVLIGAVVLAAALYFGGSRTEALVGEGTGGERVSFAGGLAIATLALISPLCPLSVALFAARISQHMVLALLAAPLIALGHPVRTIGSLFRDPAREPRSPAIERGSMRLLASAAFACALWIWHTRAPYDATFASTPLYWTMHVTLFFSAIWLWSSLIDCPYDEQLSSMAVGLFASMQMGLLGALLALAPHPIFAAHLLTAGRWNLTPLQDQQLGGAIMWVPGCGVFLGVAMLGLYRSLTLRAEQRALHISGVAWR